MNLILENSFKSLAGYIGVALSSVVFGVVVIVAQLYFPSIERLWVNTLPNSMFSFYLPYVLFYIYFTTSFFKKRFGLYTFIAYLVIGTVFYSVGLLSILSQFSINNLMMG
jgi:hypothetical protein